MEVLAGAHDQHHRATIEGFLTSNETLPLSPLDGYGFRPLSVSGDATGGVTPRRLNDCLIAAVAIRDDMELLHDDRDFENIARLTSLRTLTVWEATTRNRRRRWARALVGSAHDLDG